MRAFITGGGGFVGSATARALIARGDETLSVDTMSGATDPKALAGLPKSGRFAAVKADAGDRVMMSALLREYRPDCVIHMVGPKHDADAGGAARARYEAMLGLLEAVRTYMSSAHAKPDFKLVVASSDRVFRPLGAADAAFDDLTPYDSATPDGAAEASCALLAKAWGRSFNIPVVMTHSPHVYGPWQRKTALFPGVIRQALSGGPIALDDGETVRDWLHVADLANGLIAAAARGAPGATYLFGARSERRVLDVVLAICTLLDAKRPRADGQSYAAAIQSSEDLVGVGLRFGADPTHAEQALDWRAQYGLHLGLSELVDWVLSQSSVPARTVTKPAVQPAAQAAE